MCLGGTGQREMMSDGLEFEDNRHRDLVSKI